jgi:hypothetical protein
VSASSHENATKLLNMHSYNKSVAQKHCDTDRRARLNFVNRYLHEVHDEETGPKVVLFSFENWIQLRDMDLVRRCVPGP